MARQASSKSDSDSSSSATIGFDTDLHSFGIRHSDFVISSAWVQHFIHHLVPQTALRDSAILHREASPQVVREAKNNMAGFVLANGSMSANQSGEGEIRSFMTSRKPVSFCRRGQAIILEVAA